MKRHLLTLLTCLIIVNSYSRQNYYNISDTLDTILVDRKDLDKSDKDEILVTGKILSNTLNFANKVNISYTLKNRPNIISALIANNAFTIKLPYSSLGSIANISVSYSNLNEQDNLINSFIDFREFYIDSININIKVDKKVKNATITGGVQNKYLDNYINIMTHYNKIIDSLKKANPDNIGITKEKLSNTKKLFTIARQDFLKQHPTSWKSAFILNDLIFDYLSNRWDADTGNIELKQYLDIYENLDSSFKLENKHLKLILDNSLNRSVIPFEGEMPNGKIFNSNSLKGKVFLIDFWGSWCIWCRRSHPHLKELYAKYKDMGFEIIGIGHEDFSDKNREEQWRLFNGAIQKDEISWLQILNNPQKTDLTKVYMVRSFPTKILVDRDGKILLRVTDDNERKIDAKLEELFDKQVINKNKNAESGISDNELTLCYNNIVKLKDEYKKLSISMGKILYGDGTATEEEKKTLTEKFEKLNSEINRKQHDFVVKYPESIHSLTFLKENYVNILSNNPISGIDTLSKLYYNLSTNVRDQDTSKFSLGIFIQNLKKTSVGETFNPFTFTNINGKVVNLNKLKGKIILLDFWGSWCHPCRQSHPHLKDLYEKYKPKGLEIVGISHEMGNRERQQENWKKSVNQDGITWLCTLNDPKTRDLIKEYSIINFPTKIIIDKDGMIIKRIVGNDPEMLDKTLDQLFLDIKK